jgi:cell division cycle protein 37
VHRITGPDPTAKNVFIKDVEETYQRMVERCKVLAAEKESKKNGVEQIQIEVTGPNSSLSVNIPDPNSEEPEERKRHEIFMTLPQELRDALQTSDVKVINKVLGKMSVEEAEKVLKVIGECQALTIEEGIIDATKGETIPGREQAVQGADPEAVEGTAA